MRRTPQPLSNLNCKHIWKFSMLPMDSPFSITVNLVEAFAMKGKVCSTSCSPCGTVEWMTTSNNLETSAPQKARCFVWFNVYRCIKIGIQALYCSQSYHPCQKHPGKRSSFHLWNIGWPTGYQRQCILPAFLKFHMEVVPHGDCSSAAMRWSADASWRRVKLNLGDEALKDVRRPFPSIPRAKTAGAWKTSIIAAIASQTRKICLVTLKNIIFVLWKASNMILLWYARLLEIMKSRTGSFLISSMHNRGHDVQSIVEWGGDCRICSLPIAIANLARFLTFCILIRPWTSEQREQEKKQKVSSLIIFNNDKSKPQTTFTHINKYYRAISNDRVD